MASVDVVAGDVDERTAKGVWKAREAGRAALRARVRNIVVGVDEWACGGRK